MGSNHSLERQYHRHARFFKNKRNYSSHLSFLFPSSFLPLNYLILHYSKRQWKPNLKFKRKIGFIIPVSHFQKLRGKTQHYDVTEYAHSTSSHSPIFILLGSLLSIFILWSFYVLFKRDSYRLKDAKRMKVKGWKKRFHAK